MNPHNQTIESLTINRPSARSLSLASRPAGPLGIHAVFASASASRLASARKAQAEKKAEDDARYGEKVRCKLRTTAAKAIEAARFAEADELRQLGTLTDAQAKRLEKLEKTHRLEKCGRVLASKGAQVVPVIFNPSTGHNRFAGLVTCDRWACPVCAARKAMRLKVEVALAIAAGKREGLAHFHMVLTVQHKRGQELAGLLRDLLDSKRAMLAGRAGQAFTARWGLVGHVRVLEITYGENGWHPHIHVLWWCEKPLTQAEADQMEADLFDLYLRQLEKRGRSAQDEHAVRVIPGNDAADEYLSEYLAKMGTLPADSSALEDARELASAPAKKTRGKASVTPTELLGIAAGVSDAARFAKAFTRSDEKAAKGLARRLWVEYANALESVHVVDWSKGLKERFQVDQDADLLEAMEAADQAGEEIEVGEVWEGWHKLRDDADLRAAVVVMGNDAQGIQALLASKGIAFIPTGRVVGS